MNSVMLIHKVTVHCNVSNTVILLIHKDTQVFNTYCEQYIPEFVSINIKFNIFSVLGLDISDKWAN